MKVKKWIGEVLVFLVVALPLYAQQDLPRFITLSAKDGLSRSIIWNIAQDDKGFIWIGTFEGLNLYDGYQFKTFRHNPADPHSLSSNCISALFFDSRNRLWVGTPAGLDLYDSKHNRFIHFTPRLKAGTIIRNIRWIYEDQQQKIWVNTADGINFFDESKQQLQRSHLPAQTGITANVTALLQDKKGRYWLGSAEGLSVYSPQSNTYIRYTQTDGNTPRLSHNYVNSLFEDSRGNIWVGTQGGGLNRFDERSSRFVHHRHTPQNPLSLSYDAVTCLAEDQQGYLWIGTSEGGVNKYNFATNTFTRYQRQRPYSLADNSIYDILMDSRGGVWIGTFRGLSYMDPYQTQFTWLKHEAYNSNSVADNYIGALLEDSQGDIWIGNGIGVSKLNRGNQHFTHFIHSPTDDQSISRGAVLSMAEDREGDLWMVTHLMTVNRYDRKRNKFTQYRHQPTDTTSLGEAPVSVYCTRDGNIWVGSRNCINLYNKKQNNFSRFVVRDSIDPVEVSQLYEDSYNNLWLMTTRGIYLFDQAKRTTRLFNFFPTNLTEQLNSIHEDKQHTLWIGMNYQGLYHYNPATHAYKIYTTKDGLPDNSVQGILEDEKGNLWISTFKGLCRYDSRTEKFKVFDASDGLQNMEFNARACLKARDGKMYFGGMNGLNVFYPAHIRENPNPPEVAITDFQLFHKPVPIGPNSPLKSSILDTKRIELSYRQSVISFEFVALNFSSPEKNQYAYQMEGFDKEWVYAGTRKLVTYTNLPSGKTYTFRVKASNNNQVWNNTGASIQIYIAPPFWETWWFYTLLVAVAGLTIYLLHRWRTKDLLIQQKKLEVKVNVRTKQVEVQKEELASQAAYLKKANLEISQMNKEILQQAKQLEELDRLKSRFFANISHEFRTPLTLILAPLEEIITTSTADLAPHNMVFDIMHRNAQRLLQLINQLLELSTIEGGNVPLTLTSSNLVQHLRGVTFAFNYGAKMHRIDYQFEAEEEEIQACFDADKVEKIVFNLISNAFKFTPDGGRISIKVACVPSSAADTAQAKHRTPAEYVQITVSDSGCGIPPDQLPYVFDRFYRAEGSPAQTNVGTGIGLALTKELIELHQGKITVTSEAGKGTCFTVLLPRITQDLLLNNIEDLLQSAESPLAALEMPVSTDLVPSLLDEEGTPLLLIAEDNVDLRLLIKRNFAGQFRIEEAADGLVTWEKTITYLPDLVIMDVMMPGRDGLAVCNQLKNDPRTSHIPIILLTARIDAEQEGLRMGADDYITKPFNVKSLTLKVNNLLVSRQKLREVIAVEIGEQPMAQEASLHTQDQTFLEQATEIVNMYLADSKFEMETLYKELGMSRALVYKKLKALTGLSPNEFIRRIRLHKAAKLLIEEQLTVTDIMYRVGFNHRSYFIKCFREYFGQLPSEYASTQKHLYTR